MTTTTKISTLEIVIEQKALIDALNMIAGSIPKRSTVPVPANVKIEAYESSVSLSATNLEIYCKVEVPAQVLSCGATTVNHKELLALVKPLKKGLVVTLYARDGKLSVACGRMRTELSTLDVNEYPCEPQPLNVNLIDDNITLPVAVFRQMVNAVTPSATPEYYARPVMSGMSMKLHKNVLTFACADSHRLHVMSQKVEGAGGWRNDWILPAKILFDLVKKFPKQGEITLSIKSDTFATLSCGNLTAHVRMVDGTYSNYNAVIPREDDLCISFSASASELLNALELVAPISKDSSNIVRLHLLNGSLEIKAKRDGMDNPMVVQVEAKTKGKESELLYSLAYLQDALKVSPKSHVHFACESATKAGVMKLSDVPGFMAVIMPMHPNV